jgi:hypothetical protein
VLRAPLAAVVTALAIGLVAPGAAHGKTFRGKTSQGRAASVVTGSDNLVRKARVNWRAPCRKGRFLDRTDFSPPLDASTPDAFMDEGVYRIRDTDGIRARVTVRVEGTHVLDPARPEAELWRGTLQVTVLVTKRGRYLDTCRIERLRWRARLVP